MASPPRSAVCFMVLLSLLAPTALFAEPRDLTDVVEASRQKHDLPAVVAAVIEGPDVVAHGASGLRQRDGHAKVTVDDKFHLGSDTKAMTATLCAMLVEEGKLRWDMTLKEAFPDKADKMKPAWHAVTLEQLLTHRGGCPSDLTSKPIWPALWMMHDKPLQARAALLEAVTSADPETEPGTKAIYSNAGYAIAGHLAETVAGEPWEELMRRRVFQPLKMTTAGFGAPTGEQPWGHRADGKPVQPGPEADNPSGIGPAGIVHCSIGDWAKFIAFHLTRGQSAPGLLKPESFEKLHTPVDDFAMGWIVTSRPWGGGDVLTHAGSNTMWYCVVWMAPKKNFAVLVATNHGGDDAAGACDEVASTLILERVGK